MGNLDKCPNEWAQNGKCKRTCAVRKIFESYTIESMRLREQCER